MQIRRATEADLPGLVRLWIEFMDFHADTSLRFVRSADAAERWTAYLTGKLTEDDVRVLVADDGGELVGYLMAFVAEYPPIVEARRFGFVQEIAVTAGRRREGIAHRLFAEAERWLVDLGLPHIELRIDTDNEGSRSFWRREGFGPHTENLIKRYPRT